MRRDAARIRRLFLMLTCILGMNFLSGPSLAAVYCGRWPDISFAEATVTDVKRCLSAGADVNVRLKNGWTPPHVAVDNGVGPAVVQALVDAGADITARAELGLTPLRLACKWNADPDVVQVLKDACVARSRLRCCGKAMLRLVTPRWLSGF